MPSPPCAGSAVALVTPGCTSSGPTSAPNRHLPSPRKQVLWWAVEKVVPDIRQRVEVELVGTPLTHQRFLRRHRGTYGPAVRAGEGLFPGPATPIPGLYCCGDTTFPGIGLPAVAASGAMVANTLSPLWAHWQLLDEIGV